MSEATVFTPPHALNTAVLFLVFNRLDTTKQVFEAIRQAKPPRLYVAADGARANKEGEVDKTQAVRDYIMQNVDWECEVKTLFQEDNLGCKYAVSGAIDWFFENEEMGIILEDDCLPSQSFFWYCEALLNKYKNDEVIYLVSGDGRATSKVEISGDYSFTKYPMIWGWASWARVWKKYDPEINDWLNQDDSFLDSISEKKSTQRFWKNIFNRMYKKEIDTWDYQFSYLLLASQAKCIVPRINLIKNIGFGEGATHTLDVDSENANLESYDLNFPLQVVTNKKEEQLLNDFYDSEEFRSIGLIKRVINKLSRMLISRNLIK